MNLLVPVMMIGWIPVNIILFRKYSHQKAILISVIGGVLFLPVASYDLPMITYNKETAIAVSLLFGIVSSGEKTETAFKLKPIDIPIIAWCIISPFISIITNGLGIYNAVATAVQHILTYGPFYIAGRIYFSDNDALRLLCKGIIIGGLLYVPLVFFEVRMSPQLSNIFYGFFPHSFVQHFRYGGWRPIVFMEHGLMVSMWMSASCTVSLWLSSNEELINIKKIPMAIIVILLLISTIVCKSANGWIFLALGAISYFYFKKLRRKTMFKLLTIVILLYVILRLSGILTVDSITNFTSIIFDAERVESLNIRLFQEDIFGAKAREKLLFGWGWMERAWPRDPITGENLVHFIDSLFLIILSNYGILGLTSFYSILLIGPWKIMNSKSGSIYAVVLSVITIFFIIDSLINAMINSVFILIAGSLIGYSEKLKHMDP